jgi:D-arabinose 1-dehydrogenase-like Zn-dependent alcohol dehydrogenase
VGTAPTPPRRGYDGEVGHSLTCMRAVQITRFGGPEVMDVVDLPDPVPGDGEQLFEISSSGVNFADTHHRES